MNKNLIIFGVVVLLIIVGLSGCTEQQSTYRKNDIDIPKIPKSYIATYKVTGMADSVSLTYTNHRGGTNQLSTAYLPWERTYYSMKEGDFVYISAQINGECCSVTAEIYLNGELVKTSTSHGAYAIATSSGII